MDLLLSPLFMRKSELQRTGSSLCAWKNRVNVQTVFEYMAGNKPGLAEFVLGDKLTSFSP